jgi:mannose-6-phosphate isomerase-like protein (cupin superfamily)
MKVARWDASAWRFAPEKMQKVGLFSSERFFCDLYCLEPGQAQKTHAHTGSDKVYLVVEGSGSFVVGDERLALSGGEAVLAPASSPHGVENDSGERLVVLVFMAPPPGA